MERVREKNAADLYVSAGPESLFAHDVSQTKTLRVANKGFKLKTMKTALPTDEQGGIHCQGAWGGNGQKLLANVSPQSPHSLASTVLSSQPLCVTSERKSDFKEKATLICEDVQKATREERRAVVRLP
jgi:hypothetical protein